MTQAIVTQQDAPITAQFAVTEAQIAQKQAMYAGLDASTKPGYELVRGAIGECRGMRVAIEARRVELKADALEWGRRVDAAAKTLTSQIASIEDPLKAKKQAVDDARAAEKAAKDKAEKDAREAELRAQIELELQVKEAAIAAEEARQAAIREELEAERKVLEAAQLKVKAELDAAAAAARKIRDDAEQQRREAEDAAERERVRLAAAEQAERRRLAAVREAEEAAVREQERKAELARRLEACRPDREKLAAYASALRSVPVPGVTDEGAREALQVLVDNLESACWRLERWEP